MQSKLWIFALLGLVFSVVNIPLARAQERAPNYVPNTVLVGADGKFEADPDTDVIRFNISVQDENLQNANNRAKQAAEQIRELLRKNGLDPAQAQIGQFVVQPVYDYKNPKRKLVGYRVDSAITVKTKDFAKVGPVTQDLFNLDITGDQSVSYNLDDIDAAKGKAVQDAMHRTQQLANVVAQSSGHTLGALSYASVDTFEPGPIIRPMMKTAAPMAVGMAVPPPTEEFAPQKITVTAHVNALYELK
jgi:uncharacterized protein YggE